MQKRYKYRATRSSKEKKINEWKVEKQEPVFGEIAYATAWLRTKDISAGGEQESTKIDPV